MYFNMKNYLKNTHNHAVKYARSNESHLPLVQIQKV